MVSRIGSCMIHFYCKWLCRDSAVLWYSIDHEVPWYLNSIIVVLSALSLDQWKEHVWISSKSRKTRRIEDSKKETFLLPLTSHKKIWDLLLTSDTSPDSRICQENTCKHTSEWMCLHVTTVCSWVWNEELLIRLSFSQEFWNDLSFNFFETIMFDGNRCIGFFFFFTESIDEFSLPYQKDEEDRHGSSFSYLYLLHAWLARGTTSARGVESGVGKGDVRQTGHVGCSRNHASTHLRWKRWLQSGSNRSMSVSL